MNNKNRREKARENKSSTKKTNATSSSGNLRSSLNANKSAPEQRTVRSPSAIIDLDDDQLIGIEKIKFICFSFFFFLLFFPNL
jgi:hypothetical protein